jgi:hypothetical protein
LIESCTGLIVGEVDLIGCSDFPISKNPSFIEYHKVMDLSLIDRWKYAWILSKPKRYKEPIPYKHPKGAVIWVNIKTD